MRRLIFTAAVLLSGNLPCCFAGPPVSSQPSKPPIDLEDRTQAALKLEIDGDAQARESALRQIADESPDAALARWSLGQVRVDDQWLPYDRVVHETGRWPELYNYQQSRESRTDSIRDQLYLADGCRAHHLADEERAHLMQVLKQDIGNREVRSRLGHVNIGGFWFSPEQIQQSIDRQKRDERNLSAFQVRVERLHRDFSSAANSRRIRQIVDQMNKIRTPEAIPAMERHFAAQGPRETELYLEWLSGMDSHEAGKALARQAVLSESAQVRARAQLLLRNRRLEEYVPWLLSGLETVKDLNFDVQVDAANLITLRVIRKLVIDGQSYQYTLESDQTLLPSDVPLDVEARQNGTVVVWIQPRDQQQFEFTASALLPNLLRAARAEQTYADWARTTQVLRTDRIKRALTTSTQVEEPQSTEDWWKWWEGVTDSPHSGGKLQLADRYDQKWYVDPRGVQPVDEFLIPQSSCFSAGTQVETEQGPKPIEKIRVGDRVLSQDIETGELTFQAVFDTTHRAEATLLTIHTSDDEITCSIGHPFWVPGAGWRMARELQPGMKLHRLNGCSEIESIEEAGTGSVYNLVVADFHSYFAGRSRLSTHDVTPRQATDQVLPGVRKEFVAALK